MSVIFHWGESRREERIVEWLEIATSDSDGTNRRADVVAAITSIDLPFQETDDAIQVMPHVI